MGFLTINGSTILVDIPGFDTGFLEHNPFEVDNVLPDANPLEALTDIEKAVAPGDASGLLGDTLTQQSDAIIKAVETVGETDQVKYLTDAIRDVVDNVLKFVPHRRLVELPEFQRSISQMVLVFGAILLLALLYGMMRIQRQQRAAIQCNPA